MAVAIANGTALVTSQVDWEACAATPALAIDTTTSPGNALLAAGYNTVAIVSQIYEFSPWDKWMFLSIAGTRQPNTAYFIRFRTAATEGAIAAATYSDYLDSIQADGSLGVNLRAWCLNNPAWATGAFIQWELTIER